MKRLKEAEKEAREAAKVLKEMQGKASGSNDGDDLASLILVNQKKRADQQVLSFV